MICGIFFFVDDLVVFELFEKFEVKFKSKIIYEKICYFIINKMMSELNGNCFFYIEFLKEGNCLNVFKDIYLNRYEESFM